MFRLFEEVWMLQDEVLISLGECALNENEITLIQSTVSDVDTPMTILHMKNEEAYYVYSSIGDVVERFNNQRN